MTIKVTYKSGITEEVESSRLEIIGAFGDKIDLVSVIIPEGVKKISAQAFCNCINLESVTFPTTLKSIDSDAFKNCISLKQCHIPSKLDIICNDAFKCSGVESLYIKGVLYIEEEAFYHCMNLKSVTIDDCCRFIDESAFEGCYNMVTFNHKGIGVIRDAAFKDCLRLEKMDMSGVYNLSCNPFCNCISLTEITNLIGYVIDDEDIRPFYFCYNIKSVTVNLSELEIGIKEFAHKHFWQSGEDSFSITDIRTE